MYNTGYKIEYMIHEMQNAGSRIQASGYGYYSAYDTEHTYRIHDTG